MDHPAEGTESRNDGTRRAHIRPQARLVARGDAGGRGVCAPRGRHWRVRRTSGRDSCPIAGLGTPGDGRRCRCSLDRLRARRPLGVRSAEAWRHADTITTSRVLAGAAAAWTLVAALAFGTFAIGGADSYGYAGQARLLRHGSLTDTIPLKPAFRWPDARATLIPLGFTGGREPAVMRPDTRQDCPS